MGQELIAVALHVLHYFPYTFLSGGEEDGKIHHPWPVHAQDAHQACQEGRHRYRFWQDNQSEGQTSHKDCQGLLRLCSEKQHLKSYCASDHIRHSSPGEGQGILRLSISVWLQLRMWGYLR